VRQVLSFRFSNDDVFDIQNIAALGIFDHDNTGTYVPQKNLKLNQGKKI
jgi:hypothetical protein